VNVFLDGLALYLVLNIAVSMLRVFRGPGVADRLMSAQLFGTTGVAVLLLLAETSGLGALRNVALVFVLLAVLVTLAFTRAGRAAGLDDDTDGGGAASGKGGGR